MNLPGQAECILCAPGQFAGMKAARLCKACDADKTTGSVSGATLCTRCPAGSYAVSSSSNCDSCSVGRYRAADAVDTTTCVDCPAGQSQPTTASAVCVFCIPGMYQVSEHTIASDQSCAQNSICFLSSSHPLLTLYITFLRNPVLIKQSCPFTRIKRKCHTARNVSCRRLRTSPRSSGATAV